MTIETPVIDASNPHAVSALDMIEAAPTAPTDEEAQLIATSAVALAGLAQAYEARTASIQRYYDSLTHDGAKHHEQQHEQQHADAVLAVICDRLGLTATTKDAEQ